MEKKIKIAHNKAICHNWGLSKRKPFSFADDVECLTSNVSCKRRITWSIYSRAFSIKHESCNFWSNYDSRSSHETPLTASHGSSSCNLLTKKLSAHSFESKSGPLILSSMTLRSNGHCWAINLQEINPKIVWKFIKVSIQTKQLIFSN